MYRAPIFFTLNQPSEVSVLNIAQNRDIKAGILSSLIKSDLPVNLAFGFPCFNVDEGLKREAIRTLSEGHNNYAPPAGVEELRNSLKDFIMQSESVDIAPPIITSGVTGALTVTLASLYKQGSNVILIEPYFIQHREIAESLGYSVRAVHSDYNMRLPVEEIISNITQDTVAVITCSPNNPTGVVYSHTEFKALCNRLDDSGVALISDEVYRDYLHTSEEEHSPSPLGMMDNVFVLRGFSKSHGAAGWRVGYVIAPIFAHGGLINKNQMLYTCPPTAFQLAIARHGRFGASSENVDLHRKNAAYVASVLSDKYELIRPQGGYFCYIKAPVDELQFFENCLAKGLGVMPGCLFGDSGGYVRLSLSCSPEKMRAACETLLSFSF